MNGKKELVPAQFSVPKKNEERFKQFSEAYRACLLDAVRMFPTEYAIKKGETPEEFADRCATRILAVIAGPDPFRVSYQGIAFKKTCTVLSIRYTRKAILEWLEIKKP